VEVGGSVIVVVALSVVDSVTVEVSSGSDTLTLTVMDSVPVNDSVPVRVSVAVCRVVLRLIDSLSESVAVGKV